jgi:hypothetical protein
VNDRNTSSRAALIATVALVLSAAVICVVVLAALRGDPDPESALRASASRTVAGGAPTTTTEAPAALARVQGTWTGTYTCPQGLTRLRLEIGGRGPESLRATFDFSGMPGTGNPSGRFTMRGSIDGSHVTLKPGSWLDQPPGYSMVGLDGTVSDSELHGRVTADSPGCTTFQVRRAG